MNQALLSHTPTVVVLEFLGADGLVTHTERLTYDEVRWFVEALDEESFAMLKEHVAGA